MPSLPDYLIAKPTLLAAALAVTVTLDILYPRHSGLAYVVHPVRISYYMALRLAKPYSSVARGVAVWMAVVAVILAPAMLALRTAWAYSGYLWVAVSAAIMKFSVSLKLLLDTCREVYARLGRGDLEGARRVVGEIVRRDTSRLDPHGVASAAIESLAENLVDGYTSPLLYYPILGPIGPLLQRIANTLDGAIGYRTPEYERVGKFSAHMDTVINYVPARLTAALIMLLSPLVGGSPRRAFGVWRRWRSATESVNAGQVLAATAGALDVRLEKLGHYVINAEGRAPLPGDIAKALVLARYVAVFYIVIVFLTVFLLHVMLYLPLWVVGWR